MCAEIQCFAVRPTGEQDGIAKAKQHKGESLIHKTTRFCFVDVFDNAAISKCGNVTVLRYA